MLLIADYCANESSILDAEIGVVESPEHTQRHKLIGGFDPSGKIVT